ncbi:MAG: acetyl-CoA carboxylase biotin carboxyl carrier protein subunit [Alicyclobacillus sp.]|nr:acetyl-CoA carboxylase biotin carboxyl carrier protein subunit [Alicyclobacillus sp.]
MQITATMAGTVLSIPVAVGEAVSEGQDVIVLESMKMEVPIQSEVAGTVRVVNVQVGDFVNEGDVLIEVE